MPHIASQNTQHPLKTTSISALFFQNPCTIQINALPLHRQSSPSLLTMLKSCEAFFVYTHNLYRVLPSGFGYWWRTQRVWRIQRNLHSKSWWKHKHWDMDQCRWHSFLVIRLSLYHHWPKSPVFEIECINLCSEKNFVCRQYKRKNAQYEEIAVYAEKGKDLVQLSEITRHARHNAQVSKSLCSVRVTSKRLADRGFSSFYLKVLLSAKL